MKYRKLRIVWSAAWGVVAVLLIALWIRSCTTTDNVNIPLIGSRSAGVGMLPGSFAMGISPKSTNHFDWTTNDVDTTRKNVPGSVAKFYAGNWGHWGYINAGVVVVLIPDWFLIGVAVALAGTSWLRLSNRFSLRTLLVATTLIAAVLGLIVWSARR